ncbi:SEL1-like repeat protein [Streptomyces atacamensis]|uniref:hypothetical protein n=1 Tax=Streptomyces atacamensis TaxID=531966 RepID=UPI00399C8A3F
MAVGDGRSWWRALSGRKKQRGDGAVDADKRERPSTGASGSSLNTVRELMRRGAEAGEPRAMLLHGMYLRDLDEDHAEAERWLRAALDGRSAGAAGELGKLLLLQNRDEEAEPLLNSAVEAGDKAAMVPLSLVLLRNGDREGARAVASRAADHGREHARELLARIDAGWDGWTDDAEDATGPAE